MHRRIYGTELEYGVFSFKLVPKLMALERFLELIGNVINSTPAILNGSRLYMDMGKHPEYCTPECLTPLEVVLYEKAGERILEDIFKKSNLFLSDSIRLFKTIVDKKGNTHGYHENYLMSRSVPMEYLIDKLTPFLITRLIYSGSGNVDKEFQISGRAKYIESKVNLLTTYERPIINIRDQPLSDPNKYRRLHLIVGDPNMSEYSTFLKIGTTSLVLDLIEDGLIEEEFLIEDPVEKLQKLSETNLTWPLGLTNGKKLSAIDFQRFYLEKALRHFKSGCYKDYQDLKIMNENILNLWEEVLNSLEKDPMILSEELDWIIKKKMLETQIKRNNLLWTDPKISKLDLRYNEIDKKRSVFYNLQDKGFVKRLLNNEEIEKAKITPPNTRAKGRSLFLKKIYNSKEIIIPANVEIWDKLYCIDIDTSGVYNIGIETPDPFKTYEDEVNYLFSK